MKTFLSKKKCPVDLRSKVIQVRYDRNKRDRFIVYFNGTRMGKANLLNQQQNAKQIRNLISGEKSS